MSQHKYNFVKFAELPKRPPTPAKMYVGQVVVRENASRSYRCQLRVLLRNATQQGMTFSVDDAAGYFAIRRDS